MSEETNLLLNQMMEKMNKLQEQVDIPQSQQEGQSPGISSGSGMKKEEVEQEPDGLVDVSEAMQAFLWAAFSAVMDNEDRKKRIKQTGVPNCDQIHCPKLETWKLLTF